MKKFLSLFLILPLFVYLIAPSIASAQSVDLPMALPRPGTMIGLTKAYSPVMVKGVMVHPQHPFKFDFLLDSGDTGLKGEAIKGEAMNMIKYFMAALAVPEKDMWVNLSPYEKNRITSDALKTTALGRDMLAQDYLLKQLTASLTYPETAMGKEFWDKVYAQAQNRLGAAQIPVNAFNKVWIMPDKARVYEHNNGAFVVEARLKVMLAEDYEASRRSLSISTKSKDINQLGSQVVREIIIPALEKEVNEGRHFAPLRQLYQAVILADWYKIRLKDSILGQLYVDRHKLGGITLAEKDISEQIYQKYLKAFKKGAYSYIKEDLDPKSKQPIARKYISGGESMDGAMAAVRASLAQPLNPDERRAAEASFRNATLMSVRFSTGNTTPANAAMVIIQALEAMRDTLKAKSLVHLDNNKRDGLVLVEIGENLGNPEEIRKLAESVLMHTDLPGLKVVKDIHEDKEVMAIIPRQVNGAMDVDAVVSNLRKAIAVSKILRQAMLNFAADYRGKDWVHFFESQHDVIAEFLMFNDNLSHKHTLVDNLVNNTINDIELKRTEIVNGVDAIYKLLQQELSDHPIVDPAQINEAEKARIWIGFQRQFPYIADLRGVESLIRTYMDFAVDQESNLTIPGEWISRLSVLIHEQTQAHAAVANFLDAIRQDVEHLKDLKRRLTASRIARALKVQAIKDGLLSGSSMWDLLPYYLFPDTADRVRGNIIRGLNLSEDSRINGTIRLLFALVDEIRPGAEAQQDKLNAAMIIPDPTGGIDLNNTINELEKNIRRDEKGMLRPVQFQNLDKINVDNLAPIIEKVIYPVNNLSSILGVGPAAK